VELLETLQFNAAETLAVIDGGCDGASQCHSATCGAH
jgi:hypothetical protein